MAELDKRQTEEESRTGNEKEYCTIRGRVTYVRGSVPLAKVTARRLSATTETAATLQSATTDIAGTYQLSNLESGTYEVTITPPKDWNYEAKAQTIELKPGDVKVADFRIEKVVVEAILEGRVFDSSGIPAKGAKLAGVLCGKDSHIESAVTNSDGRFMFRNVTPGDRFVRIMLSGHLGEVHDFTIEEGQKIQLDITLKKAAHKIHGTIKNEEGKPFQTTVHLYENGVVTQKWETTNENGEYEFYVKEGECSILVQAPFYELAPWAGSVSEDKNVDFQLERIDAKKHTYPGRLAPWEAEGQRTD